jgi:hypothetical protein
MSITTDLAATLRTVRQPGNFFVSGTTEFLAPLEVHGVGPVALPLPIQAKQLVAIAEHAPFGRGEATLVIVFPSNAAGGVLLVRHKRREVRLELSCPERRRPVALQDVGLVPRCGQDGRPDHTRGGRCRAAIARAVQHDAQLTAIGRRGDLDTLGAYAVAGRCAADVFDLASTIVGSAIGLQY